MTPNKKKSAAKHPTPAVTPPSGTGMVEINVAIGPNPDGLRYQAAIAQQPDDAARQAAIAEIEAEG